MYSCFRLTRPSDQKITFCQKNTGDAEFDHPIFRNNHNSLARLLIETRYPSHHADLFSFFFNVIHQGHKYYKLFPSGCVFIRDLKGFVLMTNAKC